MAKMRATARMPRGVLSRYRTRMLTADIFEEPSPKWSRFYARHGWAVAVPDEPEPAAVPTRRARKPALPEPLEAMTISELRKLAEEKGVDLPSGYVRKGDLVDALEQAEEAGGDA